MQGSRERYTPSQYVARVLEKYRIHPSERSRAFGVAAEVLHVFYRYETNDFGDTNEGKVVRYVVRRCKWDTITEEDNRAGETFLLVLLLLARQRYSRKTRRVCLSRFTPSVVVAANSTWPDNILMTFFRSGPKLTDMLIDEILPLFPKQILLQVVPGQGTTPRGLYPEWTGPEPGAMTPLLALPLTASHPSLFVPKDQKGRASALYAKYLEFFIQRMPAGFLSESRGSPDKPHCFGAYLVAFAAWWARKDPTASRGEFFPKIFQREDSITADMWDVLDNSYYIQNQGICDTVDIRFIVEYYCPVYLKYIESPPLRSKNACEE